ncbi:hypothetical protein BY458DRAFT_504312 [Sporodiniella umbellata]|nr:hypothetical protein BY458DRAFT_504312 [Sporodiniella umbellata]
MSAATPAVNNTQDDSWPHLLSLKVIRLSKPQFATTLPVFYESIETSPLVEGLDSLNISDLTACHPIEPSDVQIRDFGLSQMLKLPTEFGLIYLGETFSTLVSVNNETPMPIHQVQIKLELQTSSQRFVLSENPITSELGPSQTIDTTVSHEIKELKTHILVCTVQYIGDGKKRHFRKFFKFEVANPLAVKTKFNHMPDGRVFLEAQLQNISDKPMFLERMKFEALEYFDFKSLNHRIDSKGQEQTVFGNNFIHPQDVRQYLYMLSPRLSSTDRLSRTTNALGKLDIVWRSAMGDMGRLQTSQLTRKVPLLEPIEIRPFWPQKGEEINIVLETPFRLGIRIVNHSNDNMKVVLTAIKTKMGSVLLSGLGSRQLGDVNPNQTTETELEFFPLTPGLQRVGGLRVTDLISGYTKDIDSLCDIFVLSHTKESLV